jgi:hypothetical protein
MEITLTSNGRPMGISRSSNQNTPQFVFSSHILYIYSTTAGGVHLFNEAVSTVDVNSRVAIIHQQFVHNQTK